ncbi:TPA: DUF2523 family protein [Escherichia coli]
METPNKLFSDYVGRIEMNQNTILTDEKIINLPRNLSSLFANLSDGFWYFINLSKLPQGISMIISAMATRFIIRRIPVIG